jgi:hypothetical protein
MCPGGGGGGGGGSPLLSNLRLALMSVYKYNKL